MGDGSLTRADVDSYIYHNNPPFIPPVAGKRLTLLDLENFEKLYNYTLFLESKINWR